MNAVYVQKDGEWHGPFSREALLSMLGTGAIAWETPCRHGSSDRVEKLEHVINRSAAPSAWRPFALALITAGLAGLIYFTCVFDVSVAVQPVNLQDFGLDHIPIAHPERVNNIGLLQTRLIGVIVSALSIVLGFLVLLLRRR